MAEEFTQGLGVELLGVEDGDYCIALELRPGHMSRAERVQGGVLFSLLEPALGRAILSHLPEGRGWATVEASGTFFLTDTMKQSERERV